MSDDPCDSFEWIGQTLEHCESCSRPAIEHRFCTVSAGTFESRPAPWTEAIAMMPALGYAMDYVAGFLMAHIASLRGRGTWAANSPISHNAGEAGET